MKKEKWIVETVGVNGFWVPYSTEVTSQAATEVATKMIILGRDFRIRLVVEEVPKHEAFTTAVRANKDNKIACIKALREYTGLGLFEAKTVVEAFLF